VASGTRGQNRPSGFEVVCFEHNLTLCCFEIARRLCASWIQCRIIEGWAKLQHSRRRQHTAGGKPRTSPNVRRCLVHHCVHQPVPWPARDTFLQPRRVLRPERLPFERPCCSSFPADDPGPGPGTYASDVDGWGRGVAFAGSSRMKKADEPGPAPHDYGIPAGPNLKKASAYTFGVKTVPGAACWQRSCMHGMHATWKTVGLLRVVGLNTLPRV
jgi:hypothetical protein